MCWVVSALTMISGFRVLEKQVPEYLHTIAFGSEVFPIRQFQLWRKALPNAKFTNLYGPTEATGMSCFYHVDRDFEADEVIPIGRPFPNTGILLLTEDNKEAAPGELGEICIKGTCLTMGYYRMPEKTAECFVPVSYTHLTPTCPPTRNSPICWPPFAVPWTDIQEVSEKDDPRI